MIIYMLFLLWAISMSSLSDKYRCVNNKRLEYFFFVLVVIGAVYVYTIRWYVGTDFGTYRDIFRISGRANFMDLLKVEKERLFSLIDWAIYQINHEDYRFHSFVYGIIIYTIAFFTIKKHSLNCLLPVMFYILTHAYTFSFNGMRQGLALTICFAAHSLLIQKKYKLYLFCIFIAMEIHVTTIMVLPFFFLGKLDITNKKLIIFECVFLFAMLTIGSLWDNIMNILSGAGQDKMVNDYGSALTTSHGAKPIRLIIQLPPLAVALWKYKNLKQNDYNNMLDYYINMAVFSAIFTVAGLRVVTLTRFASYFSIYQSLLIPRFFSAFKEQKDQRIFNLTLIVCYLASWYVLLHVDSNLLPFRLMNGTIFY